MTETNAEQLARIQRDTKTEPIADIGHYYTLLDMDFWFLVQQAGLVPTLREQESILNYEGKQLVDENKRLREALEFYADQTAWKKDDGGRARQALEGTR